MDDNEFWQNLLTTCDNQGSLANILDQMEPTNHIPEYPEQTPIEPSAWQQVNPYLPIFNPSSNNFGEASTSQTWLPTGERTILEPGFNEHVLSSWEWIREFDEKGEQGMLESTTFESTNSVDIPFIRRKKRTKRRTVVKIKGYEWDISELPTPVCSCTGTPRQCNRWNELGWQSTCCTAEISQYPLPLLPGEGQIRVQGRRMGDSTFTNLLEELVNKGYEFRKPIDLKHHWIKIGSNKFKAKK
jgi:hypothetical protein